MSDQRTIHPERASPPTAILPENGRLRPAGPTGTHTLGVNTIRCANEYYIPINTSTYKHYESLGYLLIWYVGTKGFPVRNYSYPISVAIGDIAAGSDFKIEYECLGCSKIYVKRIKDIYKSCRSCGLARGGRKRRLSVNDVRDELCHIYGLDDLKVIKLERKKRRGGGDAYLSVTYVKPCPAQHVLTQQYEYLKKTFQRCKCDGFAWQYLESLIQDCLGGAPYWYKDLDTGEASLFDVYLPDRRIAYEIKMSANVAKSRRHGVDTFKVQTRKHLAHCSKIGVTYRVLVNGSRAELLSNRLDTDLYLGWEDWPDILLPILDTCKDIRRHPYRYYQRRESRLDSKIRDQYVLFCQENNNGFVMNDFALSKRGYPMSLDRVRGAFGLPPSATIRELAHASGLWALPGRGRNVQAYMIEGETEILNQKQTSTVLRVNPRSLASYFGSIGETVVINGRHVRRLR